MKTFIYFTLLASCTFTEAEDLFLKNVKAEITTLAEEVSDTKTVKTGAVSDWKFLDDSPSSDDTMNGIIKWVQNDRFKGDLKKFDIMAYNKKTVKGVIYKLIVDMGIQNKYQVFVISQGPTQNGKTPNPVLNIQGSMS